MKYLMTKKVYKQKYLQKYLFIVTKRRRERG